MAEASKEDLKKRLLIKKKLIISAVVQAKQKSLSAKDISVVTDNGFTSPSPFLFVRSLGPILSADRDVSDPVVAMDADPTDPLRVSDSDPTDRKE